MSYVPGFGLVRYYIWFTKEELTWQLRYPEKDSRESRHTMGWHERRRFQCRLHLPVSLGPRRLHETCPRNEIVLLTYHDKHTASVLCFHLTNQKGCARCIRPDVNNILIMGGNNLTPTASVWLSDMLLSEQTSKESCEM